MSDELRAVLADSFLARLHSDAVAPLIADAERNEMPAGTKSSSRSSPGIRLVERGLLRIALQGPDGRAITQRYLRRGDIAGIPLLFHPEGGGECQAIVDTVFYRFRPEIWRAAARRDVRVAHALLEEVSRILISSLDHLVDGSLASMRQRVARELLDIAADHQVGSALVAPVTQQQLAEGIGSVREVVARALRELRDTGAVATVPDGIVIVDPQGLRAQLGAVA